MFSGIIEDVGVVTNIVTKDGNKQITFLTNLELEHCILGDSIAVNGVCLTIISIKDDSFSADVSPETLSLTTLGECQVGAQVNLEKALTLSKGINGHLVSGHIDNVAYIVGFLPMGEHTIFNIELPKELSRYVVKKGSICINGISLTVNSIKNNIISLNIVPHTLKSTTLSNLNVGSKVNVEIDMIVKYLEKFTNND